MKYLGYFEVIDSSGFHITYDLDELKNEWCFAVRIFEIPESFTTTELRKMEKPRLPKIKELFKLIYSEGQLLHEKD